MKANRKHRRTENLPAGWEWKSNQTVSNGEDTVYLTSRIEGDKSIASHINHVMSARQESALRQRQLVTA